MSVSFIRTRHTRSKSISHPFRKINALLFHCEFCQNHNFGGKPHHAQLSAVTLVASCAVINCLEATLLFGYIVISSQISQPCPFSGLCHFPTIVHNQYNTHTVSRTLHRHSHFHAVTRSHAHTHMFVCYDTRECSQLSLSQPLPSICLSSRR